MHGNNDEPIMSMIMIFIYVFFFYHIEVFAGQLVFYKI